MKIPLVDLQQQYQNIRTEMQPIIENILVNANLIGGKPVKDFEQSFAQFCGVKNAIGVSSGTDALMVGLWALGVKAGDEVILPVHTFIATSEAVRLLGATPVFVDVDEKTFNINVDDVAKKTTSKTKVIIPVHLYGYPANLFELEKLAKENNLHLLCDAAQAHGSIYNGKPISQFGIASTFSFYPGKNLGAYGDAGAIVTNDDDFAKKLRQLRDHGRQSKYLHDVEGMNARLDALQAEILSVKLKHLQKWCNARLENAKIYHARLSDINNISLPYLGSDHERHGMHLYVIRVHVSERDGLLNYLQENDVQAGIHYPVPLHLQPCYKHFGYNVGDFPVAEKIAGEIISLPMFPELTKLQIDYIGDVIENYYNK